MDRHEVNKVTHLTPPSLAFSSSSNAVAHAAAVAASSMGLRVIACCTEHGTTAQLVSEYRPEAIIVAVTPSEATFRRLAPYWGVLPVRVARAATVEEMLARIEEVLRTRGLAKSGDTVVVTVGVPLEVGQHTNLLKIHTIG